MEELKIDVQAIPGYSSTLLMCINPNIIQTTHHLVSCLGTITEDEMIKPVAGDWGCSGANLTRSFRFLI